jgi:pimeloyl-ACP methyl ester carboxylesterase
MIRRDEIRDVAGKAQAARKAVARALRRRGTYRSAVKEAISTAVNVAMYPAGVISEAFVPEVSNGSFRGRFSSKLPLRYLDPDAAATPIILLHGYFHNRSGFMLFRRALKRAGFLHVDTMNYNVIGHNVMELAKQLSDHVDEILAETGAQKVHLLGHSLGGIIARTYVQCLEGKDKVHTVVTMGSPHDGTYAAWVGRGRAARDVRPASPLIRKLHRTARPTNVRWVAYYSNLDSLVIPASSAKLSHPAYKARNVLVKDLGHMSFLVSSELMRSVVRTLSNLHDAGPAEATITALPPSKPTDGPGAHAGGA